MFILPVCFTETGARYSSDPLIEHTQNTASRTPNRRMLHTHRFCDFNFADFQDDVAVDVKSWYM